MILPLAALRMPSAIPTSIGAFLFESHWPYWIAGLLLAAILYYLSLGRNDARLRMASIAIAVSMIVWTLFAFSIDTPAERLYHVHRQLIDAAQKGDVDGMVACLAPNFQASVLGITSVSGAHEELAARLKTYGIKDSTIRYYKSTMDGPAALTQLTILTRTDSVGPVLTSWQLSWDDLPDSDWRIRDAELVKIGDQNLPRGEVIPK